MLSSRNGRVPDADQKKNIRGRRVEGEKRFERSERGDAKMFRTIPVLSHSSGLL